MSITTSRPRGLWVAVRRLFSRLRPADGSVLRFVAVLGVALMLALGAAGAVGFSLVGHKLQQEHIQSDEQLHRADARALGHDIPTGSSKELWREIDERLAIMQHRPGTLETIIVDRHFRIVAAGVPELVGRIDKNARLVQVLRSGAFASGSEATAGRDRSDYEFIQAIDLPGGRYAFEITTDGSHMTQELDTIRSTMLLAGSLAWLLGCAVFWLVGGRRVVRSHRDALQRATRDGLTELSNHRAFQDELTRAGALATRSGEPLGLLMLDLDGFKFANDRHGHAHGDRQLKSVAQVLSDGRAGDQAFRIGGDEFALLLPRTTVDGARQAADRIRTRLAADGIRVSIGIGELRRGQRPADLREEVDAAAYEAKRKGGDHTLAFTDIADPVAVMTAAQGEALDQMLTEGDVDVAFQPIWDLAEGMLLGVEALARPHPRYGFDGPAEAFDAAQQLGRLHELDVLCVSRILARAHELPAGVLLFVNICPQTLDTDTDSWLVDLATTSGIAPDRIVIEVTERVGARIRTVVESLLRLQAQGFRIAIDDVGAGNSGLEMLRKVHAHFIKLDRTVVNAALGDPNARGVLMAMAAFAHQTGAYVIAEGIEDDQLLDLVMRLDTDAEAMTINGGQGYGLGRPALTMPSHATAALPVLLRTGYPEKTTIA